MSVNPNPPMALPPGTGVIPTKPDGSIDVPALIQLQNQYIAQIGQAMAASSGWAREQFKAQMEDAQKARENAYKLGELQAETSRYGVDQSRATAMAQLEENARQFGINHELELRKFGLDEQRFGLERAKTATEFLSTPDRFAQAGRFLNLTGRILAGQPGSTPYGAVGPDRPNTMEDFAVLQAGGNPYANRGNVAQAAAAGGAGADARVKAITTLLKANPPSPGDGLDPNDFAVLNASRAIMNMRLTPQQQASIGSNKEYQQVLGSNLKMSGANPDQWWRDQQRTRPGQGRAGAA